MTIGGIAAFPVWQKVTARFRRQKLERVKSTESGKLDYLESVRGLAALVVVLAHIMAAYYPAASVGHSLAPPLNASLENLFYGLPLGFLINGHFAVVIFFVLSGFVLTYKYFQSGNQTDLHKQLAKRYFRLAIPIFVTVMVSYFLLSNGAMAYIKDAAQLSGSPGNMGLFNFVPQFGTALYDATIGVLVNGNDAYNPVLWTMQTELVGSVLVFSLAALIGKLQRRWMIYIAIIIFFNQNYLTCFVLGMALADAAHNTRLIEFARQNISPFYAYFLLALIWIPASFLSPAGDLSGTVFQSLLTPGVDVRFSFNLWHFFAALLLLTIVLVRPEIQRVLNTKILVFIGGISFALYLTHYLILHSLGDFLYVLMRDNHGVNFSALVAATSVIAVTFVVAIVWKKYVDDMSVSVSRRFARYFLK